MLMLWFVIEGLPKVRISYFEPFAPLGLPAVFSTTGFVFVSYGGLLNVASVAGDFSRGDVINITGPDGVELGRGLAEYSASEASQICGCQSQQIEDKLGYRGRSVMVHRDELVLFDNDR